MNLNDKISSKVEFITFLKELQKDFKKNKNEWENWTIYDYIESITAWLEDSDYSLEEQKISFNDLKEIFLSGKYYE